MCIIQYNILYITTCNVIQRIYRIYYTQYDNMTHIIIYDDIYNIKLRIDKLNKIISYISPQLKNHITSLI